MSKYSMFIGRFQPWHEGHRWLIDQRLKLGKKVWIAVRSCEQTESQPWNADQVKNNIESEIPNHLNRWSEYPTANTILGWEGVIDSMKNFALQRPIQVRSHISNYFGYFEKAELIINSLNPSFGSIEVHDIEIESFPDTNNYFTNIPLRLKAIPYEGYNFVGWSGVSNELHSDSISILLSNDTILFANFEPINYPPIAGGLIHPTIADTFHTNINEDSSIQFTWHPSVDFHLDSLLYQLNIESDVFEEMQISHFTNDTFISISKYSLDSMLNELNLNESLFNWYVESQDGIYTVISDTNQFYLKKIILNNDNNLLSPIVFELHQNYPNPFNSFTKLNYDLPQGSYVSLTIYDMLGNVIKNLVNTNQSSGFKSVQWNALNNLGQPVSAGVYLYSIEVADFRQAKKMILLK